MTTQLGGYEDNLNSKGSGLREITTTDIGGDKVALDVVSLPSTVTEISKDITVSGSTGTTDITVTGLIRLIVVDGSAIGASALTWTAVDVTSGVQIHIVKEYSAGIAGAKFFGLPVSGTTRITITGATQDGTYKLLVR